MHCANCLHQELFMVTLKDIAELTGFSISTVSRAFSNNGRVSEETKKKVRSAAEELMFKRGTTAQSVESIGWHIGIIIPSSGEYFRNDPSSSVELRSLRAALEQKGHHYSLITNEGGAAACSRILHSISENAMDSVIISDPLMDPSLPIALASKGIPYVIVNGIFRNSAFNQIDFDNFGGMKELISGQIAAGKKRMLVLAGPHDHLVSDNRMEGLLAALSGAGLSSDVITVKYGPFSMESGYTRCKEALEISKDFDIIVGFSDYIALGAMRAAREAGLGIPKDIAVTGFDDIEFSRFSEPPLTTVRRWSEYEGILVVETLERLISHGAHIDKIEILLKTAVLTRMST